MFDTIKSKLNSNSVTIENALQEYFNYYDKDYNTLIEAQKYGVLNGGKRIRAFLVMETCRLFGGTERAALPFACAIEMMHASSLIHDDLPSMDNDDFRRGKPSTHKVFGESVALISGDALMIKAFETLISNEYLSDNSKMSALQVLTNGSGDNGMLAGQMMDIIAASNKLDLNTLIKLHQHKTGKLISASANLGCIAAGLSENDDRYVSAVEYAEKVGLAFQIIDDILDYNNGRRELNSFTTFMSVDEALTCAQKLTQEGINSIRPYDDGTLEELANYLILRQY